MPDKIPVTPMHKFKLGKLVATPGALDTIPWMRIAECVGLHAEANWGEVDRHDKQANDEALKNGGRLMSVFHIHPGKPAKFWIITEHDRSVTTVLLPSEY